MVESTWQSPVCLARTVVCLAVALGLFSTPQPLQSQSVLVSHWELDEGVGEATTDSAASRTGTLENGATWTSGRSGSAVSMDGVDDFIALPALEVTGSAITLAAWVRNSSFPSDVRQRFISKANDSSEQGWYWMLGQINDGENRLRFRLRANRQTTTLIASTGNLPVETWYHVAATYDGSAMRLYLNGAEVGSIAKSGSLSRGRDVPVHIGRSPEGSNYLRGAIDDVRIYSSALSATEISALVGGGGPTNQPPIISLSTPTNGANFPLAAIIPVSASATDPDGTVTRVDFYAGSTLIGSDTSSPYGVRGPT